MKKLMLGNEAVARGAYEAGVTVATAYPGTPSTEITENIAKYDEIYSEWAPERKSGAGGSGRGCHCWGPRDLFHETCRSQCGRRPALYRLLYRSERGLVLMVADDPGCTVPKMNRIAAFMPGPPKLPMLEPADSQECKDFVKAAFEISEQFDTPVISPTYPPGSPIPRVWWSLGKKLLISSRSIRKNPDKYVMMPAMARKRHVEVEKRMDELAEFCRRNRFEPD